MILNVLMFKNLSLDCFTTPQFVDIEPEKAGEQLKRSIILNKEDTAKIAPYRNLALFNFGTFDDVSGKIKFIKEPQLILDCSQVIDDLGVFAKDEAIDG